MRTPYGLDLNQSCPACRYRRSGFFCQLSPAELNDFDALKSVIPYPAEATSLSRAAEDKGNLRALRRRGETLLQFQRRKEASDENR
jgi:hypothetical protein